ncbi:MAG: hypothetical protein ABIK89_00290 [Planctomycetota bacterium]
MARMIVKTPKRSKPRSRWQRMVDIEPRLAALEADALAAGDDESRNGRGEWESIRRRLSRLVGWWARTDRMVLLSNEAWDIAHDRLHHCFEHGRRPGRQSGKWPRPDQGLPDPETLEALSNIEHAESTTLGKVVYPQPETPTEWPTQPQPGDPPQVLERGSVTNP